MSDIEYIAKVQVGPNEKNYAYGIVDVWANGRVDDYTFKNYHHTARGTPFPFLTRRVLERVCRTIGERLYGYS